MYLCSSIAGKWPIQLAEKVTDFGLIFRTFSPQLENNDTLIRSSDIFAKTLKRGILFVLQFSTTERLSKKHVNSLFVQNYVLGVLCIKKQTVKTKKTYLTYFWGQIWSIESHFFFGAKHFIYKLGVLQKYHCMIDSCNSWVLWIISRSELSIVVFSPCYLKWSVVMATDPWFYLGKFGYQISFIAFYCQICIHSVLFIQITTKWDCSIYCI